MKNLKVWQKLLVMGVILMLPFGAVTWRMVSSINTLGTEFARQESRGLEYYSPLLVLLKDLQEQRGLTSLWLSGDATIKGRLDAKRLDVERDVKMLDEVDQRLDESLQLRATWTELSDEIRTLATRSANATPAASFEMHSQTIQKTIALVTAVGDASKLTLDPDLDSYYLMNVIIFQGPELAEVVAQARGLGSSIAANRGSDPAQIEELNRLAILMGFLQKKVDDSFSKTAQANGTLKTQMDGESRSTAGAIQLATDRATKLVASRGQGANAAEYFDALTPSVESLFATQEREHAALNVLLDKRISGFQWEIAQTLAWAGLGLLVVSAVGFVMTRDMTVQPRAGRRRREPDRGRRSRRAEPADDASGRNRNPRPGLRQERPRAEGNDRCRRADCRRRSEGDRHPPVRARRARSRARQHGQAAVDARRRGPALRR